MTILSLEEVRKRAIPGTRILWPYRGDVEEGEITYITANGVDVCWLEGYKSRNDLVPFDEILSFNDKKAPEVSLFPFTGRGFLTAAGVKWQQDNPRT